MMDSNKSTQREDLEGFVEAVLDVEAKGWFVWHIGRSTDGAWKAHLYNRNHTRTGEGGDVFSAHGCDRTLAAAIYACLKAPGSPHLFGNPVVNRDGMPMIATEAAIEARAALTRTLRAGR